MDNQVWVGASLGGGQGLLGEALGEVETAVRYELTRVAPIGAAAHGDGGL